MNYIENYHQWKRCLTKEVKIGNLTIGGNNPILVQSMTTSDTMDTHKVVKEIIKLREVGCQLIRVTVPHLKAAHNLTNIKNQLIQKNQDLPLVADIHFTPTAALKAAEVVEKVRINPGNFSDRKHFKNLDLSKKAYQDELKKIAEKFIPLIEVCKKNGTALRIGTNHGSLSDRIVTHYGDTPIGMVESALEFLDIAEANDFDQIIFSMKSSNPLVMVASYRLLVKKLKIRYLAKKNGEIYPLHLGVTEAGDGDDGRIKSTLGIGTLLNDGLGDTIRVSLTENSEKEIPIGEKIVATFSTLFQLESTLTPIYPSPKIYDPYQFNRYKTNQVSNIGGEQTPKVLVKIDDLYLLKKKIITQGTSFFGYKKNIQLDKWESQEVVPDYLILPRGKENDEERKELEKLFPPQLKIVWQINQGIFPNENNFFSFSYLKQNYQSLKNLETNQKLNLLQIEYKDLDFLKGMWLPTKTSFVIKSSTNRPAWVIRNFIFHLQKLNYNFPIILFYSSSNLGKLEREEKLVKLTSYFGPLLIEGLVDGLMLESPCEENVEIMFKILQASRQRIFKTEYISCPSCGRTLFDLQEVTAKIKEKTEHLKGIKIGIMGCVVNGPGEMADADFGYVGSGPGKITLYKGKIPMIKSIPSEKAVDELVNLLKKEKVWKEKNPNPF